MSLIGPSGPSTRGRRKGGKGGAGKRNENNKIYAHSLPLIFPEPESGGAGAVKSVLGLLGLGRPSVSNPHCEGIFDSATRSVWVVKREHVMILWRRGFFGKGDLSRTEPTWLTRQINERMATARGELSAEQVRERRRAERAQFKLDRAQAIAVAAAEAEEVFAKEGRVLTSEDSRAAIPSAATWKPKAKALEEPGSPSFATQEPENIDDEEEPLEDLEHLQLTLQEAWFLVWTMDCLTVLDPTTHVPMTLSAIWTSFQQIHCPPIPATLGMSLTFDNPFMANYVAYHHYRSLGWVVKGGIKFCVDLLLYKRGPMFSHAEFAIVVIPVYEEPADKERSMFDLPNQEPFAWSWLSTLNRVNSQVHKTLILTYVTIPSSDRMSVRPDSPACLPHYSVKEVIVRRFVPARMRE